MDAEHIESLASRHASRIFIEAKNAVISNEDTMKSIILSESCYVTTKFEISLLYEYGVFCELTFLA